MKKTSQAKSLQNQNQDQNQTQNQNQDYLRTLSEGELNQVAGGFGLPKDQ